MTGNGGKILEQKIALLRDRLAILDVERQSLSRGLEILSAQLESTRISRKVDISDTVPAPVTNASSAKVKIALFRELFQGREDVFPRRWENRKSGKSGYAPVCGNEWASGICEKPRVKCGDCTARAFLPVNDEVVSGHLRGEYTIGVYALLADETCRFLAVDFDKRDWSGDAKSFLDACDEFDVPAALERSRSGNGGHVWIFFGAPVAASEARALGASLMTRAMERRPEIGFESYDRFFPSQDTLPAGGFGNLIALPLQRRPRENGNSVFVNDTLQPFDDQWAFLSTVQRLAPDTVHRLLGEMRKKGSITGVRMPVETETEKPWSLPPSKSVAIELKTEDMPTDVEVVLGNQIYVDRTALPSALTTRIIRLAAFQNPEFYKA